MFTLVYKVCHAKNVFYGFSFEKFAQCVSVHFRCDENVERNSKAIYVFCTLTQSLYHVSVLKTSQENQFVFIHFTGFGRTHMYYLRHNRYFLLWNYNFCLCDMLKNVFL